MSKFSGIAHYQDFNELIKILDVSSGSYDLDKITKAYKFAEKSHGDQRRVSGIPYILHPTSVACILAELGMDTDAICSALLHDVVEDTEAKNSDIAKEFGQDVAEMVADIEVPLRGFAKQEIAKFVVGKRSLDTLDAYFDELEKIGVELIEEDLIDIDNNTLKHDSLILSSLIFSYLMRKNK